MKKFRIILSYIVSAVLWIIVILSLINYFNWLFYVKGVIR